jgi:ribonuclease D
MTGFPHKLNPVAIDVFNNMRSINPIITTSSQLEKLCQHLRQHSWVAIDTEFVREKTYFAQLCLIQVSTPDIIACVDPLSLEDMDPLLDVLFDESRTKVFHSGRQDLEIFFDIVERLPNPIFDTQIAASLLGIGDNIGYAALVKHFLEIELDKSMTRTDWRKRPISDKALAYAEDDVRGRLQWAEDEFSALTNINAYTNDPEDAWIRVKGLKSCRGVQLHIGKTLASWREDYARQMDRPRRWILADNLIVDVAKAAPNSEESVREVLEKSRDGNSARRHIHTLHKLVQIAKASPISAQKSHSRSRRLTPVEEKLVKKLLGRVRAIGESLDIIPTVIASRKDVEQLVLGNKDTQLLRGWRCELAGNILESMIQESDIS